MEEAMTAAPKLAHINVQTHDLIEIRQVLISMIQGMNEGPKSRERAIVVTKLEEAFLWAGQGLMKD